MPKARKLINGASFEPKTLATLAKIFDDVWTSVAPDFGDDPEEIEDARIRLATIVLALAKDHQLGPIEIARTSSRLIRAAVVTSKASP